ncbi:hypothetical protein HMPREF9993_06813, partial [Staphylococcus epidermidis NIHLM087]
MNRYYTSVSLDSYCSVVVVVAGLGNVNVIIQVYL